jgi:signal transduction histidine kinase
VTGRLRRLGYRHWTARVRLTALYGGLFLLAGLVVLAAVYLLMAHALHRAPLNVIVIETEQGAVDKYAVAEQVANVQAAADAYRAYILRLLVQMGGTALGLVAVVALAAGWVVAGRVLRPIADITATARRVAGSSLHERIRASGPRDEVRELADTFDAMLERLDTAFDGQRAFVGNASHELKTPLAISRTLVEVAMGHPDAPAEVTQLGRALLEVNARQERLIDGLLALARSGQQLTARTPLDLADLCARLADPAAGWHTRLHPAPLAGDPVLLERLVHNLLDNAVRYNVPGGAVWLGTAEETGEVVLTVANTGPVLAAADVAALFEPFRRLGADRTGSASGTGLGLSIVRSVARAHGGEATARPRPAADGGGLAVTVRLPVG